MAPVTIPDSCTDSVSAAAQPFRSACRNTGRSDPKPAYPTNHEAWDPVQIQGHSTRIQSEIPRHDVLSVASSPRAAFSKAKPEARCPLHRRRGRWRNALGTSAYPMARNGVEASPPQSRAFLHLLWKWQE